jgi:hypothetical protein
VRRPQIGSAFHSSTTVAMARNVTRRRAAALISSRRKSRDRERQSRHRSRAVAARRNGTDATMLLRIAYTTQRSSATRRHRSRPDGVTTGGVLPRLPLERRRGQHSAADGGVREPQLDASASAGRRRTRRTDQRCYQSGKALRSSGRKSRLLAYADHAAKALSAARDAAFGMWGRRRR